MRKVSHHVFLRINGPTKWHTVSFDALRKRDSDPAFWLGDHDSEGKYFQTWTNIHFELSEDAMLFQMTWL